MLRFRNNIPLLLMLMAIVAISIFQAYWLRNNYEEEKATMHLRANVLFHEAVIQCQAEKLHLDSNMKFRSPAPRQTVAMLNAVKGRLRDTLRTKTQHDPTVSISINRKGRNEFPPQQIDSLEISDSTFTKNRIVYNMRGDAGMIRILHDFDSQQDSITVEEVSERYAAYLEQESMNLPFEIIRKDHAADSLSLP